MSKQLKHAKKIEEIISEWDVTDTDEVIQSIERRPHLRYIKYLMTKRYLPNQINIELTMMGLSTVPLMQLVKYFEFKIWPEARANNLQKYYSEYRLKLVALTDKDKSTRKEYGSHKLTLKLEDSDSDENIVDMANFFKDIGVIDLWEKEISRIYTNKKIPMFRDGTPIARNSSSAAPAAETLEDLMMSEHRIAIESLLLEGRTPIEISDYLKELFKDISITPKKIEQYKYAFFDTSLYSHEDKLRMLIAEKGSAERLRETIKKDEWLTSGERLGMLLQVEKRIDELTKYISKSQAVSSAIRYDQGMKEHVDWIAMLEDIGARSYRRFVDLDRSKDRDVVEPLVKMARLVGYAFEKIVEAQDHARGGVGAGGDSGMLELYRQRSEELYEEQNKEIEILELGDIGGIEEIGGVEEKDIEEVPPIKIVKTG